MACLVSGGCARVGWGQGHAENKEAKAALSDSHASGKAVTGQRGVGGRSGWYPKKETGTRGGTHAGETSNFQEREQGWTPEQGYAPGNGAAHTRSPASPSTRAADPSRSGRPPGGRTNGNTGLDGTPVPQLVIVTILTLEHFVTWVYFRVISLPYRLIVEVKRKFLLVISLHLYGTTRCDGCIL